MGVPLVVERDKKGRAATKNKHKKKEAPREGVGKKKKSWK